MTILVGDDNNNVDVNDEKNATNAIANRNNNKKKDDDYYQEK